MPSSFLAKRCFEQSLGYLIRDAGFRGEFRNDARVWPGAVGLYRVAFQAGSVCDVFLRDGTRLQHARPAYAFVYEFQDVSGADSSIDHDPFDVVSREMTGDPKAVRAIQESRLVQCHLEAHATASAVSCIETWPAELRSALTLFLHRAIARLQVAMQKSQLAKQNANRRAHGPKPSYSTILQLDAKGWKQTAIANQLGVDKATVSRVLKKYSG